jgi:hypothetical protein
VSQSFEERIFDAVVGQFFAPQPTVEYVYNPATNQSEPRPGHAPSAAARVAADIWAQQREQILAAVKERLVIEEVAEALAAKITDDVVNRLVSSPSLYNGYDRERDAMRKLVNERVADELARRALAKMDAAEEPATS